jgi:hypothetical protein
MFERASRLKIRFDTPQGLLSIEDLWDIPLSPRGNRANLDDIARSLHRKMKEAEEGSFVKVEEVKVDETDQLRFDLVRHVIAVRLEEQKAAAEAKARREQKQKVLSLISKKEDEKLEGASLEELRELAANL